MPPKRKIPSLTSLSFGAVLKNESASQKFSTLSKEHQARIVTDAFNSKFGDKSALRQHKKERKQEASHVDSKIAKKHSKVKASLDKSAAREAQMKRGWKIDPINERATAK